MADDHPVILAGLQDMLGKQAHYRITASCTSSTALVVSLSTVPADIAITDFTMPGGRFGDGLSLLGFIRRRFPQTAIIVLTAATNPQLLAAILKTEIAGLISKADSFEHVIGAIEAVRLGQIPYLSPAVNTLLEQQGRGKNLLTKRESEVLRLFVQGLTVSEISNMMARSVKTVSAQKLSAMRKLGMLSDAQLFDYAARVGLVATFDRSEADDLG